MDADRNLLFGILTLQAGLVDSQQFVEACTLWSTRKDAYLADLLVERGWLLPSDRTHLEYLLERRLEIHGGSARASMVGLAENVKRSLVALGDGDIQRSLSGAGALDEAILPATVEYRQHNETHYTTIGLHASGGIGHVWLVRDNRLGRTVALKELRPEHVGNSLLTARFLREARITGRLEHSGVVPVYELCGPPSAETPFYTMRFLKGRTLAESIRVLHAKRCEGQVDSEQLLTLLNAFVSVCNTVAFAHSCGVIHRDLKGGNVVLGDFGEAIVLDWGLAKLVREPQGESDVAVMVQDDKSSTTFMTQQGQALGTPAYMAPEQAAGHLDQIDHLTDVYGLGAMLYEILTGQPPFTGSDTQEVLHKVQHENPLLPEQIWPEVPGLLSSACMRALAKKPEDRFPSASELAQAVQRWQETEKNRAQDALRASEALYHSLVESIPMNVWRKDANGRFTFANQGFCESSGRKLTELLGKTDFDVFPKEQAEKYRSDDVRVIETGTIIDTVEEHVTYSGQRLHVRVIKVPIVDDSGKIIGTQGTFWDVTDRKRLEEALAQAKDEISRLQQQLERWAGHRSQK